MCSSDLVVTFAVVGIGIIIIIRRSDRDHYEVNCLCLPLMLLLVLSVVDAVLRDLKENPASKGYNYKMSTIGSKGSHTTYVHATCRPELDHDSCNKCLANLRVCMLVIGKNAIGAHVQLAHCSIHFEPYSI